MTEAAAMESWGGGPEEQPPRAGAEDSEDPFAAMAAMLDAEGSEAGSNVSWEAGSNHSASSAERPTLVDSGLKGDGQQMTESSRLEAAQVLREPRQQPPPQQQQQPAPRDAAARSPTRREGSRPFPALGTRFCCVKRATVRSSAQMDSEKVGFLDVGEEVVALEYKLNGRGQLRVRFERGWTSTTTLTGSVLLQPVPEGGGSGGSESDDEDADADADPALNSGFVAASDGAQAAETSPDSGSKQRQEFGDSLGEGDDSSPGRVVYTIEDEEGQQAITPMLYMAAKKAMIRSASRLDSPRIGLMSRGELILVTHTKTVGETLRLRFGRGWTSAIGKDGRTIFIAENNPNRHYRALKLGRVSVSFDESSETIGTITKNSVIEGVETREILPRADRPRYRIRLKTGGWATEVAKNGVRLLTLVTFQRPDEPPRPAAPGVTSSSGFEDSPRKMIKRSGISSGVTVTFGKGPLGLGLAENLNWMSASAVGAFATVVERFNLLADGTKGPAEDSGRVHVGDLLVAVSGTDVRSEDHVDVLTRIRACPRPFTITFCEPRLLAGLVLESAPPRARRLSGGMLRELKAERVRSLSLQSTSDGSASGEHPVAHPDRSRPNYRGRRRHLSDPRNSRVSASDRVVAAEEDEPDDHRVVERRRSGGSVSLMPIEDAGGYEVEEPLSDHTYKSSNAESTDIGDPARLVTRPGVTPLGRAPDVIAGRIDYDSASDLGDEGAFDRRSMRSLTSFEGELDGSISDDGAGSGSDSVGLRSFAEVKKPELESRLLDAAPPQSSGFMSTPNPLAGVEGGLLSGPAAPQQMARAAMPAVADTGAIMIDAAEVLHKTGMLTKRGENATHSASFCPWLLATSDLLRSQRPNLGPAYFWQSVNPEIS